MNKYRPMAWIINTQTRTIKLFIKVAGKNGEDQHLSVYSPLDSKSMSSYHIQDLRLVLPPLDFDVRVNKHCAKANALFREWLKESLRGDVARTGELSNHRFDLLCALCFPTIDLPQLLRISKLCALTFLVGDGHVQAETSPSQWHSRYVPRVEPAFKALNRSAVHSGSIPRSDLLNPEHLLEVAHSLRTMQAQELKYSVPVAFGTNIFLRFTGTIFSSLYSSRKANTQNHHLGLLETFAILENIYDRNFSNEHTDVTLFTTLWIHTTNIVIRSQVIRWRKQVLAARELTRLPGPSFLHIQTCTRV